MSAKTVFCPFPSPRRGRKRFEKTRSRMVYHAILGLGDFPQQASRWQLLAKETLLAFFI